MINLQIAKAQELDESQVDTVINENQINEVIGQVNEVMTEAVQVTTNAFSAALGPFVEGFMRVQAMSEACSDEDKKNAPMTKERAEEIIKIVSPDHVGDFTVNVAAEHMNSFAVGDFNIGNTKMHLELVKSYCLYIMDDMVNTFNEIPYKAAKAVSNAVPEIEQDDEQEDNQPENEKNDEGSSQSYTFGNDEVNINKFIRSSYKGTDVLKAFDENKQSAYAIIFIGTLGIKASIQGKEYKNVMEQFLSYIDTQKLQQLVGDESPDEIKDILNKKAEEKLEELRKKSNKTSDVFEENINVSDNVNDDVAEN